ncbi:MMPL family transporter [Candidatus Pacearchaeota archaeon]|nr:MMPL family transporter [Candidatus Pacearchaeota archaeon]
MLSYLQKFLGKLGEIEYKYFYLVVIFILILTGLAFVGITKLEFESDFSEFDPTNVPAVALDKKVGAKFSSFKSFLVIVQLDDGFESDINDIRDPRVMEFLVELDKALREEQKIQGVNSVGLIFQDEIPEDLEGVKEKLSDIPGSNSFFNSRYSMTPVFISADVSGDSDKIEEMNQKVRDIVESSSKPGGVKAAVTGEPPLLAQIFNLMIQDGIFTIIIATIVIFFMLLIIQGSVKDSMVIILPVLFGVSWTIGGMGWFHLKITVATAAIGAMLLGLGVEYSIFLNSRYKEEYVRANSESTNSKKIKGERIRNSLIIALSTTGASTISSGATTMIGFLALTLSVFPMLSDMGFSLGMGIGLILSSVMVVGPIMIISRDRFTKTKIKKKAKEESKFSIAFEKYGEFVSNKTWTVIILSLLITMFMFYGSNFIEDESIDFDTILPANLEELKSFNLMKEEFEDTTSVVFFIELDQTYVGSDEPIDIRDPRIIKYTDILAQKAERIVLVEDVRSLSFLEKQANNGIIPGSLAEQKNLLEDFNLQGFVTEDYSAIIVKVIFSEDALKHQKEVVEQLYEIVETTEKPAGITSDVTGGLVLEYELNKLNGPDSSKTGMIAFGIIIVFLFLLSRSIKYTVLPLVVVVVAILWILGMVGYFQVGWNNITSSVISMTIGIGIDFGIQLSNRFRQELEEHEKREAMTRTLKYTLYPMIITVVAALIGFQAMMLGQLKLMGDLGRTMSFGMVSSMLVAVSLVAGLMLIFEKDGQPKSLKKENNN